MWMPEEPKGLSPEDLVKWKRRWSDKKGDPAGAVAEQRKFHREVVAGKYQAPTGKVGSKTWQGIEQHKNREAMRAILRSNAEFYKKQQLINPKGGSTADRVIGMLKQNYATTNPPVEGPGRSIASRGNFGPPLVPQDSGQLTAQEDEAGYINKGYSDDRLEMKQVLRRIEAGDGETRMTSYDARTGAMVSDRDAFESMTSGVPPHGAIAPALEEPEPQRGNISGYQGGAAPGQGGVEFQGKRMSDAEFASADAANTAKLKSGLQRAKLKKGLNAVGR